MYKYKVGDKVLVLPINGDSRDYPYIYLTDMEDSCAGKVMTIKHITHNFCNERESQRKYFNGDKNCYFLAEDPLYALWHSSMFRPVQEPDFVFIDMKRYI